MRKILALIFIAFALPVASWAQTIVPIVAGTVTIDTSTGNTAFKIFLTSNVSSLVILQNTGNPPAQISMQFVQDATGSRTVAFAANIINAGTITSTASATTVLLFVYDSNTASWYGVSGGGSGGGGSGTVNPTPIHAPVVGVGPGTTTVVGPSANCTPPTTNGIYDLLYNITASTATDISCPQLGLAGTPGLTGATSTYTFLYSDNSQVVTHDAAGSAAIPAILPTPTTLGNPLFATSYCNYSAFTDTITPTTWTINGNASVSVLPNSCLRISVDPNNAALSKTNWLSISQGPGVVPTTLPSPLTQELKLAPSTTSAASYNVPSGPAPTSPVQGDCWQLTTLFQCYNGSVTENLVGSFSGGLVAHEPILGNSSALVIPSVAWIDVASQSGADFCAKLIAALTQAGNTNAYIDARGFSTTQTCSTASGNPFVNVTQSDSPLVILMPCQIITTDVQWYINTNDVIIRGCGNGGVAVMQISSAFPTNTAIFKIGDGASNHLIFGTRIENQRANCGSASVSGCYLAQLNGPNEWSGLDNFNGIGANANATGPCIIVGNTAANPGHYVLDQVAIDRCGTGQDGIQIQQQGSAQGKISRTTCNNTGFLTGGGGACIHITNTNSSDQTEAPAIYDTHMEGFSYGVFFDSFTYGSAYNVDCTGVCTDVLRVNTTFAVSGFNLVTTVGSANVVHNVNGQCTGVCTIPDSTDAGVQAYIQSNAVGGVNHTFVQYVNGTVSDSMTDSSLIANRLMQSGTGGLLTNVTDASPAAGDLAYYNGTTWTILAGNASGTNYLSETSSGVPSWSSASASVTWNGISNPSGNQTLTMTGDSSTWNWAANQTQWDTSGNLNLQPVAPTSGFLSSPIFTISGSYENAATPTYTLDKWPIQDVCTTGLNGSCTLNFTHSGTAGFVELNFGAIPIASGTITSSGGLAAGTAAAIQWTNRSQMLSGADGIVTFENHAGTGFTRLNLGGTTSGFVGLCSSTTVLTVCDASGGTAGTFNSPSIGVGTPGTGAFTTLTGATLNTTTNCSSSASPAVCGSAAAGSVAMPTNAVSSSIVVNTTAVTANSQILVTTDDTLGTKLGVTCNSTVATLVGGLTISARTAGTSFTIANNVAVVTNPLCVSYLVVN